jgi:MFS family permease
MTESNSEIQPGATGSTGARAWAITALLFFFMMINFADKAIIGLAGVPIMTELNLTPSQFGLVGSSFFFLFSISAVVVGFIANHVQARWALLTMGVLWALMQAPMLGTVSLELLIACRIVLGAAEGPAYPIAVHAAYKWFPDHKRAIPSAIISQGASLGVIIAIPVLSWIITNYNWHYAFGALGLAGILWSIAWSFIGKEGSIVDQVVHEGTINTGPPDPVHIPYRVLLLSPTNLGCWCAGFGAYFGLALILAWFTPYLIEALGIEQGLAGKLTALPFIVGSVIVIGGSWLSQRLTRAGVGSRIARGIFCGIAVSLGGIALLLTPYANSTALRISLIVAGTTLPSIIYTLAPLIIGEIVPSSQRGAVLSINNAVATLAGIIAPFLMGNVIESARSVALGYSYGFVICGAVTLAGGILALILLHPERDKQKFAARTNADYLKTQGPIDSPLT